MHISWAEDLPTLHFKVEVRHEKTGSNVEGASVSVFEEGKLIKKEISDKDGNVTPIDLRVDKKYKVVISKDGFQQKLALINTEIEYVFGIDSDIPLDLRVSLFEKETKCDLSFLDTMPMIKFFFNWSGKPDWNENYTKSMSDRIQMIRDGNDKDNVLNYFALCDQGEEYYMKDRFESSETYVDSAIFFYEKAKLIFERPDVLERLGELKRKKEMFSWTYDEFIAKADQLFQSKSDLLTASLYYQKATEINSEEQYPYDQMYAIEPMIYGEYEMDWGMYSYYRNLLKEGYQNTIEGNYDEALKFYQKALKHYPDDPFPKQKIDEVNALKAQQK